ncbi:ABC transporter substrate-binding protein [Diaphorobacter ruginosibacter]|uniref:ABC transporter substrate-binding protein n=1 Tax=Diaphorobacter ruginosibacter TaxID=1715720 RepID=A0A7G9RTS2_9BURK|nr:ABC transporter substrate-binding protein [Diaphorobacter ruginosibacter]QNN58997.1 ABC transporter substrate-binding protein [Diaphorobacter ruginosibacter]
MRQTTPEKTTFTRRAPLAALLLAAAWVAGAQAQPNKEVIMQDPGGAYGDALRKLMYDPFTKATGIPVKTVQEARSGPRIKAQIAAGKTEWDLVFVFDQETKQLADCCLADIDYKKLSPSAQKTVAAMPADSVRPKGIALQVIGVVMAWNDHSYPKEKPKNWADFWDVKKFPGKRCLPGWSRFVYEAALMADGVPMDKLYPIDADRALRKIAEIKPHVAKWWQTSAQAPQLLLDGEADMCMAYVGRISDLNLNEPDSGMNLTWNQGFTYYDFFSIPKNSPNPEAALKLLSWRLDANNAARLAEAYPVPVPSPLVYEAGDPKKRRNWSNNPENMNVSVRWSADYWGAPAKDGRTNEEYLQERLNALLAK